MIWDATRVLELWWKEKTCRLNHKDPENPQPDFRRRLSMKKPRSFLLMIGKNGSHVNSEILNRQMCINM